MGTTQVGGAAAGASRTAVTNVPWWLFLLEGLVTLVIGLLVLTYPAATVIALVQFLGLYWLIVGLLRLIGLFEDRRMWGLKLCASILGILAGVSVLQHPLFSPLVIGGTIIILLGIDGILIGALDLVRAFEGGGWSIGIVGVVNVLLGLILLSNPLGLAFALPMFIGVVAIIGGIASIGMAFRVKALQAA
jgi:uncharacterized membrane protein HdeD (DUF308 family)